MKKLYLIIISILMLGVMPSVCEAKCSSGACHCGSHSHGASCNHSGGGRYHSGGSDSRPVYWVNRTYSKDKVTFPNCKKHYAVTVVTTDFYSDGSKRVRSDSTVYNADGSVLIDGCYYVKHIMNNNNHYFLARTQDGFQIINANGENVLDRSYSYLGYLNSNRFIAKYNKRYGIIDINGTIIVPIKYQKLTKLGNNLLITKLNRYYGLIDINNVRYLDDDCNSIKPLYDTYVFKRDGKYGLLSLNGELILPAIYDKIKSKGSYIIIKSNKKYGILDTVGMPLSKIEYKKVKLEKNKIKCTTDTDSKVFVSE